MVDGAEPLEGDRLQDDLLLHRGEGHVVGLRLPFGSLDGGELLGRDAELRAAGLREVLAVAAAPLDDELGLETVAPGAVERLPAR
ncbi:MAG: hypothetical protein HY900_29055 [Deltaproteobacteria bacterium]|nr:hypothetical protein [Deltaproteobacteria bacterium]